MNLRSPAQALRARNARFDRLVTTVRVARQCRREDPVVIYSMGKAGTSTVSATLAVVSARPVYKVHAITPAGIDARRSTHGHRPTELWAGEQIRRSLRHRHDWTLISCVREPIARAVSAYFYSGRTDPSAEPVGAVVERLAERDWFDDEMKVTTGIDVYDHPFEPSTGRQVYRRDGFKLLVLRTEDIRRVGPEALREHLGLAEAPTMLDRNIGGERVPGRAYDAFKAHPGLSRSLVEKVYRTRMAQHFYSDDERAVLADRWSR